MSDLVVRYLHFIGIIVFGAMLVVQHVVLKPSLPKDELKKLAVYSVVLLIAGLLVYITGVALWQAVGKPAEFYTKSPIIHIKMTLFLVTLLLSVFVTFVTFKLRRSEQDVVEVPKHLIMIIRLQLLVLFILPVLGVMMAAGIGLSS